MMIDAFLPEGVTSLAVDSIFMMPQLGVLANIDNKDHWVETKLPDLDVGDEEEIRFE